MTVFARIEICSISGSSLNGSEIALLPLAPAPVSPLSGLTKNQSQEVVAGGSSHGQKCIQAKAADFSSPQDSNARLRHAKHRSGLHGKRIDLDWRRSGKS